MENKNNNVGVEGLDMHYQKYHRLLYQTLILAIMSVCLGLQNCSSSIFTKVETDIIASIRESDITIHDTSDNAYRDLQH